MTISKVVSFLSGSQSPVTSPRTAQRIRQAAEEAMPLDQLVYQLRQMFTAPHERLCEARFDEMLDILDEQKSAAQDEMDNLEKRIAGLNSKLEEDYALLSVVFRDALAKSRDELEQKMEMISQSLHGSIQDLDQGLRGSLGELSQSFSVHVEEDEAKRERDRQHSMTALEQRIAQWRAEIDDMRRDDMGEVASSMMDIGQRLLALRKL